MKRIRRTPCDRRSFLLQVVVSSGAAGWLAGQPGHLAAKQAEAARSKVTSAKPWQIGCFTRPWGRFHYTVAMDAIAEASFKYVGLMSTKPKGNALWVLVITAETGIEEAQRAGEQAKRRGLQVVSVYGGQIPVARSLEAGIAGLRRLIDNCRAAGSPSLLLSGAGNGELEESYYKAIAECCEYSAERQVEIALKPHGPLNATGLTCRKAIERVGHPNFRLWYDPGNIFAYSNGSLDPVEDAATVDGLVTGMCIKDYDPTAGVTVTPGTGRVDFPQVLTRLNNGGFVGGSLVIETLTPGDLDSLVKEARKARRFAESLLLSIRSDG